MASDAPRAYLQHELGDRYDPARVDAFLEQGPRMVEFFQSRTSLAFIDGNAVPDFHAESPGAREGGRSVCAAPFDARELGPRLAQLRPPLDLIAPWGMGIAVGADLSHFMNAMRSWRSFAHVSKRVARHFVDLALHGRGMRLVTGNALVARLAKSAFDLGVELRVASPATRLLVDDARVVGAAVATQSGEVAIHASRGVVLACGGFPHDVERRRALFAHAPTGREHWSAAVPSATGDGLRLGEAVGGIVEDRLPAAAGWAPVSEVPRPDGSTGHFPHLVERAKPGLIAVTRNGRRFANEADAYSDFMTRLFASIPRGQAVEAWLLCDHRFIRRYGLGYVRPAPLPLGSSLRSGYLTRGRSIGELARGCGIDAKALEATIDAYNRDARDGRDREFGRGATPYNRVQGDAAQRQPLRGADRAVPFLRRQDHAGQSRHLRGAAHRRAGTRPRPGWARDRRALRLRQRHGEHDGRALSQRRHHARPGDDFRLHRRASRRRRCGGPAWGLTTVKTSSAQTREH